MGAMAAIGAEAVSEILVILENPKSSEMQIGLANWALAFIGDRAPDALREAACSDNNRIRKAAISALGSQIQSLNDDQAKELLTNALGDTCSEIRAEAATLLGKLKTLNGRSHYLFQPYLTLMIGYEKIVLSP